MKGIRTLYPELTTREQLAVAAAYERCLYDLDERNRRLNALGHPVRPVRGGYFPTLRAR